MPLYPKLEKTKDIVWSPNRQQRIMKNLHKKMCIAEIKFHIWLSIFFVIMIFTLREGIPWVIRNLTDQKSYTAEDFNRDSMIVGIFILIYEVSFLIGRFVERKQLENGEVEPPGDVMEYSTPNLEKYKKEIEKFEHHEKRMKLGIFLTIITNAMSEVRPNLGDGIIYVFNIRQACQTKSP